MGIVLYLCEVVLTRIYVCVKTHRLSVTKKVAFAVWKFIFFDKSKNN